MILYPNLKRSTVDGRIYIKTNGNVKVATTMSQLQSLLGCTNTTFWRLY